MECLTVPRPWRGQQRWAEFWFVFFYFLILSWILIHLIFFSDFELNFHSSSFLYWFWAKFWFIFFSFLILSWVLVHFLFFSDFELSFGSSSFFYWFWAEFWFIFFSFLILSWILIHLLFFTDFELNFDSSSFLFWFWAEFWFIFFSLLILSWILIRLLFRNSVIVRLAIPIQHCNHIERTPSPYPWLYIFWTAPLHLCNIISRLFFYFDFDWCRLSGQEFIW